MLFNSIRNFIFIWRYLLVLPHVIVYYYLGEEAKNLIREDIEKMNLRCNIVKGLSYYLLYHKPYRNIFYYRIGIPMSNILRCFLPRYDNFYISCKSIGGGAYFPHPYATIINAKSVGKNFVCRQCTTIGNKIDGRNDLIPTIGDNVTLGANVVIIGNILIGDNVVIGAGSVVVKDVEPNSIVAGNPARTIKQIKTISY